ncbi:MAG: hypothetical protein FNP40_01420 [Dehalobacter sp. 4CP]|uniref:NrfD/PsrC family molybdoenzyme membrane anchor subunit n=1 Tax=Dehalobacter sp. CP TaxID=2594474 RepID=UPI0013C7D0BC|nr:hypothetical protein [Dehalobacter sp. 4CP]
MIDGILIVSGIFTIICLILGFKQIRTGHPQPGFNNSFPWGLFMQSFFFFSALGSGLLLYVATVYLFNITTLLPAVLKSIPYALGFLAGAGVMVALDMGQPFQLLRIVTGLRWTSPLTWDFYLMGLCAAILLYFSHRRINTYGHMVHSGLGVKPGFSHSWQRLIGT